MSISVMWTLPSLITLHEQNFQKGLVFELILLAIVHGSCFFSDANPIILISVIGRVMFACRRTMLCLVTKQSMVHQTLLLNGSLICQWYGAVTQRYIGSRHSVTVTNVTR